MKKSIALNGICLMMLFSLSACTVTSGDMHNIQAEPVKISEDVQVAQIKAIKSVADKLISIKALSAGDRVVLIKLGYFLKDLQAEALLDDSLTAGLLVNKVTVFQNADVTPLLFRQIVTSGSVSASQGVALATGDLGSVLEEQRRFSGRLKDSMVGLGASKIVLYRWIFVSGIAPQVSSGNYSAGGLFQSEKIQNRLFIRVIDSHTGLVLWSDYVESS